MSRTFFRAVRTWSLPTSFLIIASIALAGCGQPGAPPIEASAGPFALELALSPDPPRQQGNVIDIEVRDGEGRAVDGADLRVEYSMPAMGAMPEMRGQAEIAERGSGRYRGKFDLPMGGSWTLTVKIDHASMAASAGLGLTVGSKGLRPLGAAAAPASRAAAGGHTGHDMGGQAGEDGDPARYTCPMHPSVQSPEPGQCPICGMNLTRVTGDARGAGHSGHDHSNHDMAGHDMAGHDMAGGSDKSGAPAYYTCPMHPSVRSHEPGQCPICGMNLTPVSGEGLDTGSVTIAPERLQEIGVRTTEVVRDAMTIAIRTVGRVTYDERLLSEVSVKYRGWIGKLHVNQTGQRVDKGEPLFDLYSPELFAAQQELLAAVRSRRAAAGSTAPDRADYLVDAARRRLRLWDLGEAQIDAIVRSGKALEHVPILAPGSGYVVEKNVVEGAAVEPGMRLFRIAGLEAVWVEAEIYEQDADLVKVGQDAGVSIAQLPGRSYRGSVSFVYPYLDDATRTARARIELDNADLVLKPDMYADVRFEVPLGVRTVVPEQAILYAGERRFVFVGDGNGRFTPRKIEVGHSTADRVEVLSGLHAGESVVTSGNFLVAAESRLKLALEQWR